MPDRPLPSIQVPTNYQLPLLLALIAGGLAGNHFRFELFFNIDFLFGSIFTMLALQLLGPLRGTVVAAVIASYTIILWNHPYAILIMTAEAAAVSWLVQRRKLSLVLADSLFWLLAGMPLVFLCYHLFMNTSLNSTLIIMQKQAINGIFSTVVARAFILGYFVRSGRAAFSYREGIGVLLAFFILFPALLMMALDSRGDFEYADQQVRESLCTANQEMELRLKIWVENRTRTIAGLAEQAAVKTPGQMQPFLEHALKLDRQFLRIALMDSHAVTVAFSPSRDELGRSTIGLDYSDRTYLPELRRSLQPMFTDLEMAKAGKSMPRVSLLVPLVSQGQFRGYLFGALSLDQVKKESELHVLPKHAYYTLLDRHNRVIISNRNDLQVMHTFSRPRGMLVSVGEGISYFVPEQHRNRPSAEKWKHSWYIAESTIGAASGWKLVLEQPIAPLQDRIFTIYTRELTLLLLLIIIALGLAELICRYAFDSLERLVEVAYQLPVRCTLGERTLHWPKSPTTEITNLISSLQWMADTLIAEFEKNNRITEALECQSEKLAADHRQLVGIIEGTNAGTWEWQIQTGDLKVNERWAAIAGYTLEELAPITIATWVRLCHPEDLSTGQELLQRHFSGELDYFNLETRMQHKSGNWIWILDRGRVALRDKDGTPLIMLGTHLDITERKQREAVMEVRLRLMTAANDRSTAELLCVIIDELEALTNSSIGFFHFLNKEQDTISLQAWSSRTVAEFCRVVPDQGHHYPVEQAGVWADAIRERRPVVHNDYASLPHRKGQPEGHPKVSRELVAPVIRNGLIVAIIGVGNKPVCYDERDSAIVTSLADIGWDIIEGKLTSDKLWTSQERYRAIVEAFNGLMYICSQDAHIEFMNDKLISHIGRDATGERCHQAIFGNPSRCPWCRNSQVHTGNSVVWEMQNPRDGRWYQVHSSPVFQANGSISRQTMLIDISEQQKLKEQLIKSQKMEAVGELAGGLAHDFNNMLSIVNGYCCLLEMGLEGNNPLRDTVGKILSASKRAGDLTHRLLAFSRAQVLNPHQHDLGQLVSSAAPFIQRITGELVELKIISRGKALPVLVDENQLVQVLINLAANARDAMPEGGSLTINVSEVTFDDAFIADRGFGAPGCYGLITFRDTGEGIDEETRRHIFEPFFSTKAPEKGTGLGLAMVYGIIKQHNGYVDVSNQAVSGTQFELYLPLIEPDEAASAKHPAQVVFEPARRAEQILLVEDNTELRDVMRNVLERAGYVIHTAADGQEGVERFREYADQIRLVIMDLIMPRMSGKLAYDEILKIRPATRALLCSGYSAQIVQYQSSLGEHAAFMSKPVLTDELLQKVREMLAVE